MTGSCSAASQAGYGRWAFCLPYLCLPAQKWWMDIAKLGDGWNSVVCPLVDFVYCLRYLIPKPYALC